MCSVHGPSPGDGVAQPLVLCTTNVETLLCVECDAFRDVLKVVAELSQHVAGGWVCLEYQPQVVEPART